MTISAGERLPEGQLMRVGDAGPEPVSVEALTKGRKVALFGVPGAFTPTCSSAHLPSFMQNADAIRAKGVDEIVCLSVNDAWVMDAWGQSSGAADAGISMLADPSGDMTVAMGLDFSVPAIGFTNRARRFAAIIEDGTVTWISEEEEAGTCNLTAGNTLLENL